MKRLLSLLLSLALAIGAVHSLNAAAEQSVDLGDPEVLSQIQEAVYSELAGIADSDSVISIDVQTVYISQEYIDEIGYNSKANVFFGYTLAELNEQFGDTAYVFTLGEDGQTIAIPFENYNDIWDRVIRNYAIGFGVVLVLVTVSVVSAQFGQVEISLMFAERAAVTIKTGIDEAFEGGLVKGLITYLSTGEIEPTLESAALESSEDFMLTSIMVAALGEEAGESIADFADGDICDFLQLAGIVVESITEGASGG